MPTRVLVPDGVHYDLDESDRPPRWPWVLGVVLLAALVGGLLLTFHPRLSKVLPGRRSQPSSTATTNAPAFQESSPTGPSNLLFRLPAGVDGEVRHLIEGAEAACRSDDLVIARRRYLEILARPDLGRATPFVEQRLGEIGMLLVLTPHPMPEKTERILKRGESVERIAHESGVSRELLLKSNDIRRPERMQAGQRLLVLDKPVFRIEIKRGACELRLFLNGKLLKRYAIGTGRRGETPVGTYVIRCRQERPVWRRPDGRDIPHGNPENVLGTRWISLQATGNTAAVTRFGLHGTWDEGGLGQSSYAGGIRMRNAEIEELCLVIPDGTTVQIVE